MKTVLLSVMGCAVLASCVPKVRTAADFDHLPHNKGIYGGSFVLTPWEYCNSDGEWHHFYCQWSTQNWVSRRRIKISRDLVSMPLERPAGGYYKTISMEPVLRDGRIVSFKRNDGQDPVPTPHH